MIKLDTYTDENVFEEAKKYIKSNLKTGDYYTTSMLQRTYSIGYNKASRILEMLSKEKIIKFSSDRVKAPMVL